MDNEFHNVCTIWTAFDARSPYRVPFFAARLPHLGQIGAALATNLVHASVRKHLAYIVLTRTNKFKFPTFLNSHNTSAYPWLQVAATPRPKQLLRRASKWLYLSVSVLPLRRISHTNRYSVNGNNEGNFHCQIYQNNGLLTQNIRPFSIRNKSCNGGTSRAFFSSCLPL